MIGIAIALQRVAFRDYSLWIYLFGGFVATTSLGTLGMDEGGIHGVLYFLYGIGMVVASVLVNRRVLLVFGVISLYTYVSNLAFEVFDSALGFSLALAVVGLMIVVTAVWYQRGGWTDWRVDSAATAAPLHRERLTADPNPPHIKTAPRSSGRGAAAGGRNPWP